jgi:hypothetical protein
MDGLDLSKPDVTTAEELAAFREAYRAANKGTLASYEFWAEFRPDVLKRHKARTPHYRIPEDGERHPVPGLLAAIHHYAVVAFGDGVAYECRLAQTRGALRSDILDTLSVAFIHAGHPGMFAVAGSAEHLRSYVDPPAGERFPAGWEFDPRAFESGMDFSTPEASEEDLDRLRDWYLRTIGEVPRYVRFLAGARPGLLKAYRDRYEHAIRDSLPKQMMPFLMLQHHVVRGCRDGIRENVLLGRAFGMTRTQLLNAICSAVLFAGAEALGVVGEAAGDVLPELAG